MAQGEVPDPATSTSGGSLDSLPELAPAGPPAFVQRSENDAAKSVIVCEPGLPKMMGALHPAGSLYERPVNLETSKIEHAAFRQALRREGVFVLTVRQVLLHGLATNLRYRLDLEDYAMGCLRYRAADPAHPHTGPLAPGEAPVIDQYFLSDEYKRIALEKMDPEQLIDVIMTNPTVEIKPSYRDTGFTAEYTFSPLANLVFTRDQQITTAKGIVMASLRSKQREREVSLMKFVFRKLGIAVTGEIREPGFLEGGDFFPAGADLCFVGVGLRSNFAACRQLMDEDLLGTRRLAVVRDELEQSQDRMHLDCAFSILGEDCVLMLEEMMGEASPTRRLVDEYVREGEGPYALVREGVEFSRYLRENGYNIIPVAAADQLKYACNTLNLGNSNIISVHKECARAIARNPHFRGKIQYVPFSSITAMYGAVHCATQVVSRIPGTGPR